MSNPDHGNRACPHFGLKEDADTALAFPSVWNCCHRSRRIASPNLRHQAEYCLAAGHRECPVFLNQQPVLHLPHQLRGPRRQTNKARRSPPQTFGFIVIGLLVLGFLGWSWLTPGLSLPMANATPSPTVVALMTPSVTATATVARPPTRTMTVTPATTATGARVSKHQLELPIGAEYQFVIHRVLYGENLNHCAARYNTTIEAIMLVNYGLKAPVWVDTLVIIPVETTRVLSLPAFEAYEVTEPGKTPESLAHELGVDVDDLKQYNALGAGERLSVGDWLLIPHPRTVL